MYKVLLVDDERIILDGISRIIDWGSLNTELSGTARNGLEAFEFICKEQPHIVISDIRMPGMDGLTLASKINESFPNIRVILLTGFGEFEYAQKAMHYGVKHYLLKPCNETDIVEALKDVIEDLTQNETKEDFLRNMRSGLEKVMPYVKEQFLKEFVTNKTYGSRDWEYYRTWLNLNFGGNPIRLILFQLEGRFEFEHLFALKNIAEEVLGVPLLSSTIGDHVLTLLEDSGQVEQLQEKIEQARQTFMKYYKMDVTIAMSDADDINHVRRLYKETLECLNYRFYLGEGSLITRRDILAPNSIEAADFSYDEERLCLLIKSGRWEDAKEEIDRFFLHLSEMRLDNQIAKSHIIQLFVSIIRLNGPDSMRNDLQIIGTLVNMDTLHGLRECFEQTAKSITMHHYNQYKKKNSTIIDKMIEIIHKHISNPELSLNWVANQLLYMNADYLGKLFKKETGDKFSSYVIQVKVNKAIEMIEKSEDVKVFELAESLGFGDNPQYFSQVFKKHVGCTPSEYKRV
jgi:two-component system, response regulator YesN